MSDSDSAAAPSASPSIKERMSSMYLSAKTKSSSSWDSFSKSISLAGEKVSTKTKEVAVDVKRRFNYAGRPFGGRLELLCSEEHPIPIVLKDLVEYMDDNALDTQGIFRIPGPMAEVDDLKRIINRGESVDWSACSSHLVLASLLLMFLNELQESVIPSVSYPLFTAAMDSSTKADSIRRIKNAILALPPTNVEVLRYVCAFLMRATARSSASGLHSDLAAIIFAPVIMRCTNNTFRILNTGLAYEAIGTLIDDFDLVFPVSNVGAMNYSTHAAGSDSRTTMAGVLVTKTRLL